MNLAIEHKPVLALWMSASLDVNAYASRMQDNKFGNADGV